VNSTRHARDEAIDMPTNQAATITRRRRRLASRLYDWLDARRWYW